MHQHTRKLKLHIFLLAFLGVNALQKQPSLNTKDLIVYPIAKNTWVHVTFLETEEYGRVACNGMIYRSANDVAIFDTPIIDEVSDQLIQWVENELDADIKAVIINHHHLDCLGGLQAFHDNGTPSYAHSIEITLAKERNAVVPTNSINETGTDTLMIGGNLIINFYPGPAHTMGNIVSYVPESRTLFGGCMVKTIGAGKGNLADADTLKWTNSISTIMKTYPDVEKIVPGHGKTGSIDLLKYTADLFKTE